MKYVVVTGGVVSGLGKGITSSSIGVLLKASGLNVTSIKIDPYLNTDAGTMSPYEHGEVYVLDDGGEADLDLGNYERFLETTLTRDHNITTGKVYQQVINRERKGDYLGKTVQVVPHVTDAIQDWIERVAHIPVDGSGRTVPDVCMIELGGTVGDIESMVFLEALRQFRYRVGNDNMCLVHVSLVPVVGAVGEPKSKPTQHGVRELRAVGLSPDIILCRSTQPISRSVVGKISQFCMVPASHVLSVHDVSNIFKVPVLLCEQRVPALVMNCLRINKLPVEDVPNWRSLSAKVDVGKPVTIAIIGKYTGLSDSYLSVTKSLDHAAIHNGCKLNVQWVDSSHLQLHPTDEVASQEAWKIIESCDGILVPGGFGNRGVEGMIRAVTYAREKKKPYLGICLGMQVAVIEYCRTKLGLTDATSAEFDQDAHTPVIIYMPEISTTHMGGTMRLGSRQTNITENTLAQQLYNGEKAIMERHRHRYEVNPEYVDRIAGAGLIFSGRDDRNVRMEIIELPTEIHPFFVATQYHPEFKSRPFHPAPVFNGLIAAASGQFVRRNINKRPTSGSPTASRASMASSPPPSSSPLPSPVSTTSSTSEPSTPQSK